MRLHTEGHGSTILGGNLHTVLINTGCEILGCRCHIVRYILIAHADFLARHQFLLLGTIHDVADVLLVVHIAQIDEGIHIVLACLVILVGCGGRARALECLNLQFIDTHWHLGEFLVHIVGTLVELAARIVQGWCHAPSVGSIHACILKQETDIEWFIG